MENPEVSVINHSRGGRNERMHSFGLFNYLTMQPFIYYYYFMLQYPILIDSIGRAIDLFGVIIMAIGIAISVGYFVEAMLHKDSNDRSYNKLRKDLAKTILLGLEFLVAGDIIRSIAVPPTFSSVLVLAIIVIIRSFLSFEFEYSTTGRLPWQKKNKTSGE